MKNGVYFISGIDTNIGKTIATGFLAKNLMERNKTVITQKLIQTGNQKWSEDVLVHRRIMQIPLQELDFAKHTMPEIFSYPASPHLAARIDRRTIDFNHLVASTAYLKKNYDIVLVEGAGGIMVPLSEEYLTLDYIIEHQYPLILVTSGKLGSINHTLLNLELIKNRKITLYALAYNHYHPNYNQMINQDTARFLKHYLCTYFPDSLWLDIPNWSDDVTAKKQLYKIFEYDRIKSEGDVD